MEITSSIIVELENGLNIFNVESQEEITIEFHGSNKHASLFIDVKEASKVNVVANLTNGDYTFLYWNDNDGDLIINEDYNCFTDANLKVAFTDLNDNDLLRNSKCDLNAAGSTAILKSSTLASSNKNIHITANNNSHHTSVDMENYAIALKDSIFNIIATGAIKKACVGSKNYQLTNCLTFGKPRKANIEPILLIDENDVEAGHGSTVGRVDDDTMYYLQSRGLSDNEAIRLLASGYLLPIADMIEDETLKEDLSQRIISKVDAIC